MLDYDDQLKGVKLLYFGHVRLNDFYLGHETIFIVHKQIIKPSTRGRPDKDFILQMYQRPHQKHSNRFIKWFHDFSVKIFSRQYLRSIVRPDQSLWLVTKQSKPPRRKSLAEHPTAQARLSPMDLRHFLRLCLRRLSCETETRWTVARPPSVVWTKKGRGSWVPVSRSQSTRRSPMFWSPYACPDCAPQL